MMMPCILTSRYQNWREACYFHVQGSPIDYVYKQALLRTFDSLPHYLLFCHFCLVYVATLAWVVVVPFGDTSSVLWHPVIIELTLLLQFFFFDQRQLSMSTRTNCFVLFFVAKKEVDDGNTEDYIERLKLWEEQKARQAEVEQTGDHEMEGGYKLTKALWCKLYK